MDEIREAVSLITDARSANEFASSIKEMHHVGSSLMMARSLFASKTKELGLIYDKESGTYQEQAN